MAISKKTIDDWRPDIDGIGLYGGGGGGGVPSSGGSIAGVGLGAIVAGAIAAGMAGGGSSPGVNIGGGSSTVKPGTEVFPGFEEGTNPAEPPKNEEEKKEEDKQILPPIPGENEIKDETSTNVEQAIDNTDTLAMLRELRDEQWAREDAIRAETQAREDTAFSRGITDMRRAGVNVNLVGAQPAESGGGITNATGVDGGIYSAEVGKYVSLLETTLNNEFKGDENTKDRINGIIGGLIQAIIYGYFSSNRTTTVVKKSG